MDFSVHNIDPVLSLKKSDLKQLCVDLTHKLKIAPESVTIIFVTDEELTKMHEDYLHDASPTDVITFDLGEESIEGEIYISMDRAKDQAKIYKVSQEEEIIRLVIHGMLHLAGYDDRAPDARLEMKKIENAFVHDAAKKITT